MVGHLSVNDKAKWLEKVDYKANLNVQHFFITLRSHQIKVKPNLPKICNCVAQNWEFIPVKFKINTRNFDMNGLQFKRFGKCSSVSYLLRIQAFGDSADLVVSKRFIYGSRRSMNVHYYKIV